MLNKAARIGYMDEFPDFGAKGFDLKKYNQRFLDANVIINASSKAVSYPPHWGALSLKCTRAGIEFYKSSNACYAVDPGNYLLFNEGKVYSSWIDSDIEVQSFTLNIAPAFEKEVVHSLLAPAAAQLDSPDHIGQHTVRFTEKLYPRDHFIMPVVDRIHALSNNIVANRELLHELFALLVERLVGQQRVTEIEISALSKLKKSTRVELFERLTRAKDFMYSSFNHEISSHEVADIACLNQHYFLRQFKSAFQITPHQFLTRRRMEVAASLLRTTDKSILEVCSEVGFSDPASFSKLFRRTQGTSPRRFRKTTRGSGK